ncbi:conserved exported protein of unknown function [Hyphomicrobium sp. 1Nfss2.1]|uniref:hypothetical protein n=1 Tax=Hyphomicrobium sp. 1Nfss2.1 TaxID=3413936 RepID=UPI003C7BB556
MVRRLVLAVVLAAACPFALPTRALALDPTVTAPNAGDVPADTTPEGGAAADPGSGETEPAMPDPGDVEGEPYPPDGVTDPNVTYPTDGPSDGQGVTGAQMPEGAPKDAAASGEQPD